MKKLLLLSTLISPFCFSQIVLNENHFPIAEDLIIYSTLTDGGIDYLSTGANYTWDFSSLVPTSQEATDCRPVSEASALGNLFFGNFAAIPYKASYFNEYKDFALNNEASPVTIEDVSLYSKSTSTTLNSVGYEFYIDGQGLAVKSDTIETRYFFPLLYGDSYSSRGFTKADFNPIYDAKWRQHRLRETEVDGWGSITTPYGTFDVLRIHHKITESDSIYYAMDTSGGFWFEVPVPVAHEYEWRAVEEKEAILRIKTSIIAGNEAVTGVEYRDNYNGLGISEQELIVGIYPNPTQGKLIVEVSEPISNLLVYGMNGQLLIEQKVGLITQTEINSDNLQPGIYLLEIETSKGKNCQRFIKQ